VSHQPVREGGGIEKGSYLLGERLVLAPGHQHLAAVPERFTRQGDFQGFPGTLVGRVEGSRDSLAVVREPLGQEVDHRIRHLAARLEADRMTGPANELPQRQNGKFRGHPIHRSAPLTRSILARYALRQQR